MNRIRHASIISALLGTGLLIVSAGGNLPGLIGAVMLIVVGTVGCVETEV